MFLLGTCFSLAAVALAVVITALRRAPEAIEEEGGLRIVANVDRGAKRAHGESVRLHPRVKPA
jgi:hypothetical protein